MLSRRPSNGLYTYNFELDCLRVTTLESATSLTLDECDYTSKLVLTLRQFRDAPRRAARKVESGYLFILHSGTNAIERLDLRKIRQSTSQGAAPAYKVRAEGCGLEFQYLCSDGKIRKISIGFRKQDEYERALQILLSQGLSVIIKKPGHGTLGGRPFAPTAPGSVQLGLPTASLPARQSTAIHAPGAWTAPPIETSNFLSREGRTLSIPMPPPVARNVRSNTHLGAAPGYYHPGSSYSPALVPTSGYYTPTQSQSQLSEETFPGHGWPPFQQRNPPFGPGSPREVFQLGRVPGPSPAPHSRPPFGAPRYGTPQSFMSSQSRHDQSLPEYGVFPHGAQQYYNHRDETNTPTQVPNQNLDSMLPPARTLPFKSKKTVSDHPPAGPTPQVRERPLDIDENMNMGWETQRNASYKPTMPGREHDRVQGLPHETSHGVRAGTMVSETHNAAMEAAEHFDGHEERAADEMKRRFGVPPPPTKDAQRQTDTALLNEYRADNAGESPSASDTELVGIFRTLEDAVARWRTGLQSGRNTDLEEVLLNLQNAGQRLEVYLHPSHPGSRNDGRNHDHTNDQIRPGDNQAVHHPEGTMSDAHGGPVRRHTREYKQWKEYYLFACRLYETKEERSDPEFIHRFLRGIPGRRAFRWVQMGLLHCYPSMVRLSDRRSGTTFMITKDLRWGDVCDMVTRKLKLPFPKWETARVS